MKILSIGTDRKLFEKDSAVRARVRQYADLVDEYHVVVFSLKSIGLSKIKVGDNLWIYPTNSSSKLGYISDAKEIISNLVNKKDGWIITTQDPFETGLVGKKLSQKFKIPLQVQIHTDFLSPYFKKQSILNKIRVHISKKVIANASCVRVVSKRIADSISRDSDILPIFVDIEKIQSEPVTFDLHKKYPQFENIILTTSRLEPERNVMLAVEALGEVVKEHSGTGLVIVGGGSERISLESKVESLGLKKNVVFEGWQNELVSYYKGADIFLNTSNYDGYGMSLIETATSGTPIVTTDVGIVGDVLIDGESTLVCSVGDSTCFANQIIRIIENKNLKNNLISKARSNVHNVYISKQEYLKKYVNLWDDCVRVQASSVN